MSTDILQQSITLPFSKRTVQNRFLKSAMTERLCTFTEELEGRGKPTPAYLEAYRQWGLGKLGVLVLGNTPVDARHLEAPGNAIIDPDNKSWDPVEAFRPVIEACKATGAIAIVQLTHAGRQSPSHVQPHPVAPSANDAFDAMGMHFNASREMTVDEIKDLVRRFANAAEVLYKAGADGAQCHVAHGYCLSQFLSSIYNRRTDQYGGSLENRSRLIFEIIEAMKAKVPESFVLSVKINSQDFAAEGGWTVDETKQLVQKLEAAGVDLIELSGGNYENLAFEHKKESTKKREGFFVEFADEIRPHIKKAVLCVTGGFRTEGKCAEAINGGSCDMVGLARPLCADPLLPANIFAGKTKGAAENNVERSLQTPAAVLQIHAFAEKRPIYDLAEQKVADEVTSMIKNKKPPQPQGDYPAM